MRRIAVIAVTSALLAGCQDFLTDPIPTSPNLQVFDPIDRDRSGLLLGTTNKGELVEIDLTAGTTRLIGDAGFFGPKEVGWTGISADPDGNLYATSRRNSEPAEPDCTDLDEKCAHLYRIDATTGQVIEDVGTTTLAYVSDIDFAADGTLFGNWLFDFLEGTLLTVDPSTGEGQEVGAFGLSGAGIELVNGGLAVDPRNGDLWAVESAFAGDYPQLFRIDPATGAAVDLVPITIGVTDLQGFDGLEILPNGRFIATLAPAPLDVFELRELDPGTGEATLITLTKDPAITGHLNGLETFPTAFPFVTFDIQQADVTYDPQGRPDRDSFVVSGTFAPDGAIDIALEDVTVVLDGFVEKVAPGGFTRDAPNARFVYSAAAPGITGIVIGDDGQFTVEGSELNLAGFDVNPTLFSLQIGNDIGEGHLTFDRVGDTPAQPPATLLATTNFGELVVIDVAAGTATLVGDAGGSFGWTGLSFDGQGTLLVSSRHQGEPSSDGCAGFFSTNGACAHLYAVDPETGSVIEERGNTGVAFLSDIDFRDDGTLFGAYYLNQKSLGDGGLASLNPGDGAATGIGAFGTGGSARDLDNGGFSVDPVTGDLWVVEGQNVAATGRIPNIFRVDPVTGQAVATPTPLSLRGNPLNFGFGALEILPDGRFYALRPTPPGGLGDGPGELYLVDPVSGGVALIPLLTDPAITGSFNGIENAAAVAAFPSFKIKSAHLRVRNRGLEDRDRLDVRGRFVSADGFDPVTEAVSITFGGSNGFNLVLPPGSFTEKGKPHQSHKHHKKTPRRRHYVYRAPRGTSGIKTMDIWSTGEFAVRVDRLDLSAVNRDAPVPFTLQIGNEVGAEDIQFDRRGRYRAKKHDW